MRPDFLRRSTPTPFAGQFCLMGRTIRLETDSALFLDRTRRALDRYGAAPSAQHDFLWRLVNEPDNGCEGPWPEVIVFSGGGLSVASIGQRSFVAVDRDAREAVSFLEERFARDETRFERLFLTALIALTAQALGLTPTAGE